MFSFPESTGYYMAWPLGGEVAAAASSCWVGAAGRGDVGGDEPHNGLELVQAWGFDARLESAEGKITQTTIL